MKSMKGIYQVTVIAIAIAAIALFPPVALAACPPWVVYSYTYYNGCNGTQTLVGDAWTECMGYSGGWGTTGKWRQRIKNTCFVEGASCLAATEEYTFWEFCTGVGWVERSQADFDSTNCQCS